MPFADHVRSLFNKIANGPYDKEKKDKLSFNPGSNLQKQEFFSMLGIESDSETAKGSPQWNRAALAFAEKIM